MSEPAQTQRRNQQWGCAAVIVFAAVMFWIGYTSPPPRQQSRGWNDRSAAYAGREFAIKTVGPALRAPSTAKFPDDTVRAHRMTPYREGGAEYERWRVTGSVDAQNAFGAMIRSPWVVILISKDGQGFPAYVELDGDAVFGRAAFAD